MKENQLTGTWKLNVKLGDKTGVAIFELVETAEDTIRGTYSGHLGSKRVSGIRKVDGFEFWFDWHHGQVKYEGTCVDNEMSGTCIYGSVGKGKFEGSRVAD